MRFEERGGERILFWTDGVGFHGSHIARVFEKISGCEQKCGLARLLVVSGGLLPPKIGRKTVDRFWNGASGSGKRRGRLTNRTADGAGGAEHTEINGFLMRVI